MHLAEPFTGWFQASIILREAVLPTLTMLYIFFKSKLKNSLKINNNFNKNAK